VRSTEVGAHARHVEPVDSGSERAADAVRGVGVAGERDLDPVLLDDDRGRVVRAEVCDPDAIEVRRRVADSTGAPVEGVVVRRAQDIEASPFDRVRELARALEGGIAREAAVGQRRLEVADGKVRSGDDRLHRRECLEESVAATGASG
jgi:hypothetical protein